MNYLNHFSGVVLSVFRVLASTDSVLMTTVTQEAEALVDSRVKVSDTPGFVNGLARVFPLFGS